MQDRELFVQDVYAGADPKYRLAVRVISEYAWQSLFARNLLIRVRDRSLLPDFTPEFTVIAMPKFLANPHLDGIHSETFILVNFSQKLVLIGGTYYGGEIKKSVFTALNYILPQKNVLSMHCSANVGEKGDTALLFGLSGTGKTTLSADSRRALIGMTNTAGAITAFLILKGAATPKSSGSPRKRNRRYMKPPGSSAPSSKMWSATKRPGWWI